MSHSSEPIGKDAHISPIDSPTPPNTYIIDIESAAETARLVEQDKLFTEAMGGLFPEQPDLSSVERILDLACGPGKWAVDVAFTYPDWIVTGVDLSRTMIKYARAIAQSQGISNVGFFIQNIKKPLFFDDASFELINGRFLAGVLDQDSWPVLLAECQRVLTPGGILRLTEIEVGVSSSPALQTLSLYLYNRFQEDCRTFSADGSSLGIAHMLGPLMQNAGFERVRKRAFLTDMSHDSPLYVSSLREAEITFALLKPYLLRSGLSSEQEYQHLYQQMLIEMQQEYFTAISFGLTVWGMKSPTDHKDMVDEHE